MDRNVRDICFSRRLKRLASIGIAISILSIPKLGFCLVSENITAELLAKEIILMTENADAQKVADTFDMLRQLTPEKSVVVKGRKFLETFIK